MVNLHKSGMFNSKTNLCIYLAVSANLKYQISGTKVEKIRDRGTNFRDKRKKSGTKVLISVIGNLARPCACPIQQKKDQKRRSACYGGTCDSIITSTIVQHTLDQYKDRHLKI